MTEYTPDTDEVRVKFCLWGNGLPEVAEQFDRWLAAYTAKVQEDTLREAADDVNGLIVHLLETGKPLRVRTVVELLRARADSLHPVIPSAAGDEIEEGR